MQFVEGLAIREIARRTGRDRKTVQRAVRSSEPPRYRRPAGWVEAGCGEGGDASVVAQADPRLPGTRVRELISELGCEASKTLVDDFLREVRPRFWCGARSSGRCIGRGSWCSAICGSRGSRSRWATVRRRRG